MARKINHKRLDAIREAIILNPKQKAGGLARLLKTDNKSISRALPHLEARGDLLMEDDNGRISWFGCRK